ncbi:putative selenium metabolism protein SsnA [Carpediemonas membranifera]|uniref:Putative selenium metabolism protein SsnA n=1 Tax=Carpediemonas membranifera TaxID=201153 RepID=A0A8J6EB34_9EUKA|nr:putative selenium metabolism protein SsnA [Carpediemonas membranifera]|eukprot:KAG9396130.1 putative selenium metabolism protein SsnA [Carpediemonas membranifera]
MVLITNARIFTFDSEDREFSHGAIFIEGDKIVEVGENDAMVAKYPSEKVFDAEGNIVMPSFVCAHTHFYGMYSRGMATVGEPAANFQEVLNRLWYRLDKALDHETNYLTAMPVIIEGIKCGTTTFLDHHASFEEINGSLDDIARAALDTGVRVSTCFEVSDRNGPAKTQEAIEENIRYLKKRHEEPHPRLHATFGLHSNLTLSNETMAACQKAVAECGVPDVGFHVHVAEGDADQKKLAAEGNPRSVLQLERFGMTGPNSLFAHCIAVNEEEVAVIKKTGTNVVHNPESNMNNGVGCADIPGLMAAGIPACLGTDGMTADMFQEHKFGYLLHKHENRDPRKSHMEPFTMLWRNNTALASRWFKQTIGRLEAGAVADLIIYRYEAPTPLSMGNFPWHMMFGMGRDGVQSTMCAGEWLMLDRKLQTIDEAKVMADVRAHAEEVHRRYRDTSGYE